VTIKPLIYQNHETSEVVVVQVWYRHGTCRQTVRSPCFLHMAPRQCMYSGAALYQQLAISLKTKVEAAVRIKRIEVCGENTIEENEEYE
jgi:hypothetical protein